MEIKAEPRMWRALSRRVGTSGISRIVRKGKLSHLCLVAHAAVCIDPDVLSKDLALLVQFHVLRQLERCQWPADRVTRGQDLRSRHWKR